MCGAYIGIDEYRSKLAVLGEKFNPDVVMQQVSRVIPETNVGGRSIWNVAL